MLKSLEDLRPWTEVDSAMKDVPLNWITQNFSQCYLNLPNNLFYYCLVDEMDNEVFIEEEVSSITPHIMVWLDNSKLLYNSKA